MDVGWAAVAGIHLNVLRHVHDALQRLGQLLYVAAGEVHAAIALRKHGIAGKQHLLIGEVIANAARRVTGRVQNAEIQLEDDYSMLDGRINNGKSALAEDKKPSVLEQLKTKETTPKMPKSPKKTKENER